MRCPGHAMWMWRRRMCGAIAIRLQCVQYLISHSASVYSRHIRYMFPFMLHTARHCRCISPLFSFLFFVAQEIISEYFPIVQRINLFSHGSFFLSLFTLVLFVHFVGTDERRAGKFHATQNPMSCSVYWAAYAWAYIRLWNRFSPSVRSFLHQSRQSLAPNETTATGKVPDERRMAFMSSAMATGNRNE